MEPFYQRVDWETVDRLIVMHRADRVAQIESMISTAEAEGLASPIRLNDYSGNLRSSLRPPISPIYIGTEDSARSRGALRKLRRPSNGCSRSSGAASLAMGVAGRCRQLAGAANAAAQHAQAEINRKWQEFDKQMELTRQRGIMVSRNTIDSLLILIERESLQQEVLAARPPSVSRTCSCRRLVPTVP